MLLSQRPGASRAHRSVQEPLLPKRKGLGLEQQAAAPLLFTDFYRFLESSFSAGSTATIATKYSFFQVFRDLQNYLAKLSKNLQNFPKNQTDSDFRKNQHFFCKNPEISQKVCKNLRFFAKFCNFFKKSGR